MHVGIHEKNKEKLIFGTDEPENALGQSDLGVL